MYSGGACNKGLRELMSHVPVGVAFRVCYVCMIWRVSSPQGELYILPLKCGTVWCACLPHIVLHKHGRSSV